MRFKNLNVYKNSNNIFQLVFLFKYQCISKKTIHTTYVTNNGHNHKFQCFE